jgi:hypothetical protein
MNGKRLLSATGIRLLDRPPLRPGGLLHCFPLFLGRLLQHLLLALGRLPGLARIFFDTGALSLSWYRRCNTQGDQQQESGNWFHKVSEQKMLQRSYTEAAAVLVHKMLLL